MTDSHDKRPARRVAEPVQVYLDRSDRSRLDRLSTQLGATKSEVLRRGLAALEHQLTDPAEHPALRIIGIAGASPKHPAPKYDAALEHDRFLAETEEASWRPPRKPRRGR
jgi:hypothetical protein